MAGKVERTQAVAAGVMFPRVDGERSTSAFGREVAATALARVDPVGSAAAAREATWRSGYLPHFRRLVEAGLAEPDDAVAIATAGADAATGAMTWAHAGEEIPLPELAAAEASTARIAKVTGRARPVDELALPYKGSLLRGDTLDRQLDRWVQDGVLEPSAPPTPSAPSRPIPSGCHCPGRTLVALGAGSEIGPAPTFLRWGATVAGIDLRRPDIWARVLQNAEESAGTLLVPASGGTGPLADHAGVDLLSQLPEVAAWVADLSGPLVLGQLRVRRRRDQRARLRRR